MEHFPTPDAPMIKTPQKSLKPTRSTQFGLMNTAGLVGVEPLRNREMQYVEVVMKTFWKWDLGLAVAATLAANVPAQETPPPDADNLANAKGQLVSDERPLPPSIAPGTPAAEIVKLAQAGVDESVMLAYVSNSGSLFNLSSDAIVSLNDLGVPGSVVTAMIQHDQSWKTGAASTPPTAPAQVQPIIAQASSAVPEQTVPMDQLPPQDNGSYSYFYDSLAPYGNWINVEGGGLCWQPTVVVINSGWSPYCNHGHWIYTDCGWYWSSDYSWGWAPFHYGRWYQHNRYGWCWVPDTVWAPAWVSWRTTPAYCGWAPLPPTACYRPGVGFSYFGRSVAFGFEFGLNQRSYTFVPTQRFCDPHPWQYRVGRGNVTQIFNTTVVNNRFDERDHRIINAGGVPVDHVSAAMRAPIPTVSIHETPIAGERTRGDLGPNTRSIAVYRPNLPQAAQTRSPFVGSGVRAQPITRHAPANTAGNVNPGQRGFTTGNSVPNNERRTGNPPQPGNQPIIIRGSQNNGGGNPPNSGARPEQSSVSAGPASRTFPRQALNQSPPPVTTASQWQQPNTVRQEPARYYSPRYESQAPPPVRHEQAAPQYTPPPTYSRPQQTEFRPAFQPQAVPAGQPNVFAPGPARQGAVFR